MATITRKNTVCGNFAADSPAVRALDVHQFVFHQLGLKHEDIACIQLEVGLKKFFLKLQDAGKFASVLARRTLPFKLQSGEVIEVTLTDAGGPGYRVLRVFRLPPEIDNKAVETVLRRYGNIEDIYNEKWTNYEGKGIENGIRGVKMTLTEQVPSYIKISGFDALILYDGQPKTCRHCHATGHLYFECAMRTKNAKPNNNRRWENINKPTGGEGERGESAVSLSFTGSPAAQAKPAGPTNTVEGGGQSTTTTAAKQQQQPSPTLQPEGSGSGEESGDRNEASSKPRRRKNKKRSTHQVEAGEPSSAATLLHATAQSTPAHGHSEVALPPLPPSPTLEPKIDIMPTSCPVLTDEQEIEVSKILVHKEAHLGSLSAEIIKHVQDQVREGRTFAVYMRWFQQQNVNLGPGSIPPEVETSSTVKRKASSPEASATKKSNWFTDNDDDDDDEIEMNE